MSRAFSFFVGGMGRKQTWYFSFCVKPIASAVFFKKADSQTLKKGCANRQKIVLRDLNFVEPEKVNEPKLTHDCEMA